MASLGLQRKRLMALHLLFIPCPQDNFAMQMYHDEGTFFKIIKVHVEFEIFPIIISQ